MNLSKAQTTEFFHIAFLAVLGTRLDPARYVLKGGANLRYFFASERYSEDIDLDLIRPVPWGLGDQVEATLNSPALRSLLAVGDLTLAERPLPSKPKRPTAGRSESRCPAPRRWCAAKSSSATARGRAPTLSLPCPMRSSSPTRCARRRSSTTTPRRRRRRRWRRSPVASRPRRATSSISSCSCGAGRWPRARSTPPARAAVERALEQDYAAFRDQVLPFLEPGAAELVASPAAWEQTQTFVADRLEAA